MSRGESAALIVFLLTAAGWITRPLLPFNVTDTHIALAAAGILFVIPVELPARRFVMDLKTARRVPWGILLLFGGGLSLAGALDGSGVAAYLGFLMSALHGLPKPVIVAAITA